MHFKPYTLTEVAESPLTYKITDPGGDYTLFTQPAGASELMPSAEAQTAGGLNKVTYVYREGKVSEIDGPISSAESCSGTLSPGCRVLTLHYGPSTAKSGEAPSEWGEYPGQLASVTFTAFNPAEGKMSEPIAVAKYAYDKQGRLRAEWDPRISPSLKTVYGYDAAGHLTALTPPGQESWGFTYGTVPGDAADARLLKATQAPASPNCATGCSITAPQNTSAPTLSGTPTVGLRLAVLRAAGQNIRSPTPISGRIATQAALNAPDRGRRQPQLHDRRRRSRAHVCAWS